MEGEGISGARGSLREREAMGGEHGGQGGPLLQGEMLSAVEGGGEGSRSGSFYFRGQEVGVVPTRRLLPVFMKQDMRPSAEKRRRWGEKQGISADRDDF